MNVVVVTQPPSGPSQPSSFKILFNDLFYGIADTATIFKMKPSQWISGISYIKIPLIQWLGWILKMVAVERIIEGDLKRWRLAWPRRWFGHNDDIYYVLSEVALTLSGERLKSVTFGHVKDLCFRLPPLHSKWRHHPPILSVSKGPWGLWYL